ncbi:hypothetical protein ASF77_22435 [Massilia sp. Leaf139]|nr:hypothetical protein ASF77_22435 [Massilia sp. Leaf139]
MTILPAPLTPADCNLQDFAFMPLDVARLRDSDMAAYQSPESCWAAVLLWSAAWHQVPAASLPDDDRFLAKAAGYGRVVKEWMNVREGALHGWVKCADGRLYHPVVAEKALESWRAKLHHAWKKECDRIRKANKQREAEGRTPLLLPLEPNLLSDAIPQETAAIPMETSTTSAGTFKLACGIPAEKPLKGEGEGQGELKTSPKPPDGGLVPARTKPGAVALQTFLDACAAAGERPLRDYEPLWRYAEGAGLSQDFVALAWVEFCRRFRPGGTGDAKRYKDWRQAFRKYVEGNYLKLWAIDGNGAYFLTTLGKQAQKIHESKEAA